MKPPGAKGEVGKGEFFACSQTFVIFSLKIAARSPPKFMGVQQSILKVYAGPTFRESGFQGINCFPISSTSPLEDYVVSFCFALDWCGILRVKLLINDFSLSARVRKCQSGMIDKTGSCGEFLL